MRRAGQLEILCRFTGLINFPHDQLECSFDIGIWDFPDKVVNLTFFDEDAGGGVDTTLPQETAGTTYQEYTIKYIETERVTNYYGAFSDAFTNLLFRVHFERATVRLRHSTRRGAPRVSEPRLIHPRRDSTPPTWQSYYVWAIEYNGILLTLVSMAVFWLDATACGERLGFGVTTVLAVQVTKNWTSQLVPTCGEFLWIEIVLLVNELFCVISLLVSCIAVRQAFKGQGTVDELTSNAIDMAARRTIPPCYVVALAVLYNIELEDGYFANMNPMFEGLATGKDSKMSLKWNVIIAPLCLLLVPFATYIVANKTGTMSSINRVAMQLGTRLVREMNGLNATDADRHDGHGSDAGHGHGHGSSSSSSADIGSCAASVTTAHMDLPLRSAAERQRSISRLLELLEEREERAALSESYKGTAPPHAQPLHLPGRGPYHHQQQYQQHQHQQHQHQQQWSRSAFPGNVHVGATPGPSTHAHHVLSNTCYAMGQHPRDNARAWVDHQLFGAPPPPRYQQQSPPGLERSSVPAGSAPLLHPSSAEPTQTALAAIPAHKMHDGGITSPANSISSSAYSVATAAVGGSNAPSQRSAAVGGGRTTMTASARELPGGGTGVGGQRLSPKDMAWEVIKRSCQIKNELDARGVSCELDKHSTPVDICGEVVKVRVPHGSFAHDLLDGQEPKAFGAQVEELLSSAPFDVRALDEFLLPRIAAGKDGQMRMRI